VQADVQRLHPSIDQRQQLQPAQLLQCRQERRRQLRARAAVPAAITAGTDCCCCCCCGARAAAVGGAAAALGQQGHVCQRILQQHCGCGVARRLLPAMAVVALHCLGHQLHVLCQQAASGGGRDARHARGPLEHALLLCARQAHHQRHAALHQQLSSEAGPLPGRDVAQHNILVCHARTC
jgi:hypothetical protein